MTETGRVFTIWFTGLSGAGKTTIAKALMKRLQSGFFTVELVDGDLIRKDFNFFGFSKEDRLKNITLIRNLCKLLNKHNVVSVAAAITPYEEMRVENRKVLNDGFTEVYVATPLEECMRRDPKGLYKLVKEGKLKNFTGVDDPFETPVSPDIIVGKGATAEESVDIIWEQMLKRFTK